MNITAYNVQVREGGRREGGRERGRGGRNGKQGYFIEEWNSFLITNVKV